MESEVVAALTVQAGLVKNKMKGGVYSRPPPLTCFFSNVMPLYCFRREEVVSGQTELVVPGPTELVVPGPTGLVVPGPTGLT